ncbi:mariner transposase [Trichonephila clavipes]|uniref:Mariner transposase n=1 Tax=Trichonephila clavipes TaxID=2585209 RepID=A0A8X6W117_TRICX|nr:mariner transposase [Trichonephila clavipes]
MHHVREGRLKLIKTSVDANQRITTREIGLRLNLSNSTVYDHLKGLGLSSKFDVWVPHVLTEINLCRRIDVCDSLPKRHENDPFLKRIITGDEKGHGAKKMNRLKPFPKPIFTKKRDKKDVRRILNGDLRMTNICAKVVPKILSDGHKQCLKDFCVDMLERIANETNLLESVVTCDVRHVFFPMTHKVSYSRCNGSLQYLKKHACQNRNSRQC